MNQFRLLQCCFVLALSFTATTWGVLIDEFESLELVFALFRHGQKTTDPRGTYPKDPYLNESYYPFGPGQLTNAGRETEFNLGKKLRQRYSSFLGNIYTPNILKAVSTEVPRTRMSLQLVLAGLYPPTKTILDWEKNLNWQPIPYDYLKFDEDHLMTMPFYFCPKFDIEYNRYIKSPEGFKIERKYSDYYTHISEYSGIDVKSNFNLFFLYLSLVSEEEWGLELPKWTRKFYPTFLKSAAMDFYMTSSATPQLKQITGGFLLKQILNDTILKANNQLQPPNRKLFLFGGHEYNVAYLLSAMNVYFPHIPTYGSCVMIEVHKVNGIYGIKIFYEDYTKDKPRMLRVPGCDYFCPLKQFIALLRQNLPRDDECNKK